MYTEFKFGVLYSKDGQTTEDDMFGNGKIQLITFPFLFSCVDTLSHPSTVETSKEYEDFLSLLGEKVKLQGWERYAAGLDIESAFIASSLLFLTSC